MPASVEQHVASEVLVTICQHSVWWHLQQACFWPISERFYVDQPKNVARGPGCFGIGHGRPYITGECNRQQPGRAADPLLHGPFDLAAQAGDLLTFVHGVASMLVLPGCRTDCYQPHGMYLYVLQVARVLQLVLLHCARASADPADVCHLLLVNSTIQAAVQQSRVNLKVDYCKHLWHHEEQSANLVLFASWLSKHSGLVNSLHFSSVDEDTLWSTEKCLDPWASLVCRAGSAAGSRQCHITLWLPLPTTFASQGILDQLPGCTCAPAVAAVVPP